MKSILSLRNPILLLLIFIPVAALLRYGFQASPVYIFLAAGLSIVPLASLMGRATEQIADRLGEGFGGLLNATFGNAAELIIGGFALRAGLLELVKASITGSIIGNVLLIFGLSAISGGIKHSCQRFNRTAASLGSTMLLLSAAALVVPAIYHRVTTGSVAKAERELSFEIAVVLIITYLLSLIFALKTHRQLYMGERDAGDKHAAGTRARTVHVPLAVLVISTLMVAWMSELLVGAAEEAAKILGMNEIFAGVIVIAIIGNAAEHSTAVLMARKNRMDISINIALGSSIQIALFVAPVLLFLSYLIAPSPMNLVFTTLEVVAIVLAAGIMAFISQDGETNWMEGVQLVALYVILGIVFFNLS